MISSFLCWREREKELRELWRCGVRSLGNGLTILDYGNWRSDMWSRRNEIDDGRVD